VCGLLEVEADLRYFALHSLTDCQQTQHDFWQVLAGSNLDGKLFSFKVVGAWKCSPWQVRAAGHEATRCFFLEFPDGAPWISNATKGLSAAMEGYDDTIFSLKKVRRLVTRKESKEILLERCFNTGAALGFKRDIERFHAEVYEDRWNTVSHAICSILDIEVALCNGWNLHAYSDGAKASKAPDPNADDEHDARLDLVDAAILDAIWWAKLVALRVFAQGQRQAVRWASHCPCHWPTIEITGSEADAPRDVMGVINACPLRGRRGPELANGEFFD
ncbi:unnamed protein product, partial [Prorocentrum cordatum]